MRFIFSFLFLLLLGRPLASDPLISTGPFNSGDNGAGAPIPCEEICSEAREEERKENPEEPVLHPELQGILLVSSPAQLKKRALQKVEGVVFSGVEAPEGNEGLAELLAEDFLCEPLTQSQIERFKREVARYYREGNYPVVKIVVPEQNFSSGVLQAIVIEARLGKISVKGNQYNSTRSIEKWARLTPGEKINELTLLKDISWMNTNPFRRVSIVYRPGEQPGTSDVDLMVSDRRAWRAYIGGDNTGTPLIGRTRWFTGINLANVFLPDHMLSFQFTTCNDFQQFKSYTFQYAAPLPWRNTLSFFGAYATVRPNQGMVRNRGKTYQMSGRYTVPQWFSRRAKVDQISYEVGFDFKGTNNNIIFGDDNTTPIQQQLAWIGQFAGSVHANLERGGHKAAMGVELFWSPGQMLSHQTPQDYAGLRAGATAEYIYTRLSYNFEQTLPFQSSFYFQGRFQFASAPLLASEQFALGGYSTVRGYDERVVNGDSAMCFNLELRTPRFSVGSHWNRKVKDSFYFLGFFDAGYGWDQEQVQGFPLSQTLLGIGAGFRYQLNSYFSTRCDLGFPLKPVVNDSDGNPRVHISVIASY